MKLSCTNRGLLVLAATVLLAVPIQAQYYPIGNSSQGYPPHQAQPHQAFGPQYSGGHVGGQQFMPGTQLPQAQYPQTQYAAQPQFVPQPQFASQSQYVAMAKQGANGNLPTMNQSQETVPPGGAMQSSNHYEPRPVPMDYSQGSHAQGGYENYSGGGYSCENYGGNCQPNSSCGYGGVDYASCRPRRHWFGGVYGLLMERSDCDYIPLAFRTTQPADGYYPTDDEIVLSTKDLDSDLQGGAEVRFGATFARFGSGGGYGGCCDPCGGCQNSCGGCGTLGWEIGYWALAEDTTSASYSDTAAMRTYGMKSYQGLEFNHAGVWRPLNHAADYAPPTEDHYTAWGNIDMYVRNVEVTRSFSVQNVEWNLVCLPTIGGGCAPACDSCGGGGCDSCGGGSGGSGQQGRFGGGCGAYCYTGPRCQCSTSLGVRYLRFDEDFTLRFSGDRWNTVSDTYVDSYSIAHYVEADNHLVGFQVGGNGCYHLGCRGRAALHFSSNAGIYGNHSEVDQYMSGPVRYANGNQDAFNINAEDDNIAFVGELRLGASYQCTCHCRLYGGYRALGVSGVALSTSQLADPYMTPAQTSYVDCSGSIFLHGLQSGVEFMY